MQGEMLLGPKLVPRLVPVPEKCRYTRLPSVYQPLYRALHFTLIKH